MIKEFGSIDKKKTPISVTPIPGHEEAKLTEDKRAGSPNLELIK